MLNEWAWCVSFVVTLAVARLIVSSSGAASRAPHALVYRLVQHPSGDRALATLPPT